MSDRRHKSLSASSVGDLPHLKSLMKERLRVTGLSRERVYELTRQVESEFFRIYKESLGDVGSPSTGDAGLSAERRGVNPAVRPDGFLVDEVLDQPLILMI